MTGQCTNCGRCVVCQLVQLLLRHGANPLSKNADSESPLDVASTPEVTQLLRSEIISSSSSDDEFDVRSPTSPESTASDVNDSAVTSPPDTACAAGHTQLGDDKPNDGQRPVGLGPRNIKYSRLD